MGYEFCGGRRPLGRTASGKECHKHCENELTVAPGPGGATVPPANCAPAARNRRRDPVAAASRADPAPPVPTDPADRHEAPAPCDGPKGGWWIVPAILAGALVWSALLALAIWAQ